MVLEHLFPENWLEKKVRYAFIIAFVYSCLGIMAARLLFGANSGIGSIVFASLLILPYLKKLFEREERREKHEIRFSIRELWKDNRVAIKVYLGIFLGIFLTYALYSFLLPQMGLNTFSLLKEQLFVDQALRGHAFDFGTCLSILTNNWWVLLACFLLALFTGDGAIFFIAWNASAWGTLFGYRAVTAAAISGANPWWYLLLVIVITFPHMILEGGAYILAAISGSIISDDIIEKSKEIRAFLWYAVGGTALFLAFYFFYKNVIGATSSITFSLLSIVIITGMIHFIGRLFKDKKHKEAFIYNYNLFIIALVVFAIGALVETFVLNYSQTLNTIYWYSAIF